MSSWKRESLQHLKVRNTNGFTLESEAETPIRIKQTENRKIKNASAQVRDGLVFDSLLEAEVYGSFKQSGLIFELKKAFTLLSSFVSNGKTIAAWTHEVDFFLELHGYQIVVEVKGWPNDVYSYKLKMLRYLFACQYGQTGMKSCILFIHTMQEIMPFFKLLQDFALLGSEAILDELTELFSHPESDSIRRRKKAKARAYRKKKHNPHS